MFGKIGSQSKWMHGLPLLFSFAWKNTFHLGFFAVEGDSQIWCMNVMFSANKIDLISLSCLNLWLLRLLLAVIRILIRLNAERKNLSAQVVIGHIQGNDLATAAGSLSLSGCSWQTESGHQGFYYGIVKKLLQLLSRRFSFHRNDFEFIIRTALESGILKKITATTKVHSDYLVVYLIFPQLHLGHWWKS